MYIILEVLIAILVIIGIIILCRSAKKAIIFSILTIVILLVSIMFTLKIENTTQVSNEPVNEVTSTKSLDNIPERGEITTSIPTVKPTPIVNTTSTPTPKIPTTKSPATSIPVTSAPKTPTPSTSKPYTSTDIKATKGIDGNKGVIYLTFDDGPSSSITPKILDILKKKNVKATFFILNYNDAGEQIVKREIEEGHTVAIHGYSHNYNAIYQSVDTYMQNITMLQDKIKNSTGYNATITRFPGGSSNTVSKFNPGIMTKLTKEVINRGYKYFDWNVSSGDAGGAKTPEDVYNNVTKGLSKSRINVVLMHDFSGNTKTLNALEAIIDYGIQNGYTFSNITENTPMITHRVNN